MGPLTEGEQNRLIIEFVGLVRPIAAAFYSATSPPLEELCSEGHLGLVFAARQYDPKKSDFRAFAAKVIRNKIIDFIRVWKKAKIEQSEDKVERDWVEWQVWPHVAPFENWTTLAATPEELLARFEHISKKSAAFSAALLGLQPKNREMLLDRYLRGRNMTEIARKNKISYHKLVRILDKALKAVNGVVNNFERRQAA